MATPLVSMKVRGLFFDRPKVRRSMDRATRQALSKAGAFVRQRSKSGIRQAKRPRNPPSDLRGTALNEWFAAERKRRSSDPGEPPRSQTGLLKRSIFFSFEPARKTVVIGPVKLASSKGRNVPSILEFGGRTTFEQRTFRGRRLVTRTVAATIQPRPYMGPALQKELPNLPKRWRNSVRGG